MRNASRAIAEERLRLSKSPASEIAQAALDAQQAAGLDRADFLVIAVEPGQADVAEQAIDGAIDGADPR